MILITGASGKLGKKLKEFFPEAKTPNHKQFDVEDFHQMAEYVRRNNIDTIIHCAAVTSPPYCDEHPTKTISTNIIGTSNLAILALYTGIKLVYISTEYVYEGTKGNYKEDDPVYPVNRYGWSKLGGECAVRILPETQYLIVRCAFGQKPFPYPKAPVDQYSSRQDIDTISDKIYELVSANQFGVYNIGGKRMSVYDYAKTVSPDLEIEQCSIKDFNFVVPVDASLDTSKYEEFIAREAKQWKK